MGLLLRQNKILRSLQKAKFTCSQISPWKSSELPAGRCSKHRQRDQDAPLSLGEDLYFDNCVPEMVTSSDHIEQNIVRASQRQNAKDVLVQNM